MFPRSFRVSVVLAGAALGMAACSSDSPDNAADDGTGTPTGPATTATMTSATSATTGTTATVATVASSATVGTTTSTSGTTGTTGTTGSTTATSTTAGSTTGTSTTGAGPATGAGGMSSSGSMSGSGGAGGTDGTATTGGDEDFDPQPDDFTCITEWQPVLRFHIHNFLGHTDEAIAVAENPDGGVYPVGTILQHFPTEAMVKRHAGFSPETKDWEFFLLTLNQDGTTTIAERGPDITTAQGAACAGCHADSPDQYDFVCNTYAEAGGGNPNCGFPPLSQQQLDSAIAMDPRCD